MAKNSESDTDCSENSSSDDKPEIIIKDDNNITLYEKQRLERIKENKARMEALRLPTLASSLLFTSSKNHQSKKKVRKEDDDDEDYIPSYTEDCTSSSNEEDDQGFLDSSGNSTYKGKKRQSLKKNKRKKKTSKRNRESELIDDEEALQLAIALSLGGSDRSGAILYDQSQKWRIDMDDLVHEKTLVQDVANNRKKIRNMSGLRITEDQVVLHFYRLDGSHCCKYCGEIMGCGPMTSLMQHLAGSSSTIAACKHVPSHVKKEMLKYLSKSDHIQLQEEDPELRLQRDLEEAVLQSMNDPEYKEMEEIKIAILESQRLDSLPAVNFEVRDKELDMLLGFSDESEDEMIVS